MFCVISYAEPRGKPLSLALHQPATESSQPIAPAHAAGLRGAASSSINKLFPKAGDRWKQGARRQGSVFLL